MLLNKPLVNDAARRRIVKLAFLVQNKEALRNAFVDNNDCDLRLLCHRGV
jgi:hypothetical protein